MSDAIFSRLAIVGIGLIGSSIARAARQNGLVDEIAIADLSPVVLKRAEELGLGDSYHASAGDAAAIPPASTTFCTASGLTSQACTSKPSRSNDMATPMPMAPSPTTPTGFLTVVFIFKYSRTVKNGYFAYTISLRKRET